MAKSKTKSEKIKLKSTESAYFYTAKINKANMQGKLELNKYDPIVRKHVKFKQEKI